jgi:hypothetical protein
MIDIVRCARLSAKRGTVLLSHSVATQDLVITTQSLGLSIFGDRAR